ncbi:MAG TPA: tetratricopeptide repeat protein [Nitrospinota bacterium]|nr:tetratricopeptide repeat protein [Nitrospinota bacterium]|tara:strand:+ start:486 stop:2549 length:2064 start_codon:yes stop_codon:yes gene_type:complete
MKMRWKITNLFLESQLTHAQKSPRPSIVKFILICVTLVVFWPVCNFDFLSWDDNLHVYNNPHIIPSSLKNALYFWQKPYEGLYSPLIFSAWAIMACISQFLGDGNPVVNLYPQIFHPANLIIHCTNVIVVYAILKIILYHHVVPFRQSSKEWAAVLGALFFSLHPIQVEAVAWITGMKDLLSGLFSLIAIWQYLEYVHKKHRLPDKKFGEKHNYQAVLIRQVFFKKSNYLIATIAFMLALLSKPLAVVVPMVVWVIDYYAMGRSARECSKSLVFWFILVVPWMVLTKLLQPDEILNFITPLWSRPVIAGDALVFYLQKIAFPIWLGPDYGRRPDIVLQNSLTYYIWLIPCGLLALVWFQRKKKPWLTAPVSILFMGVFPVLGLIPFRFQIISTVADRYLYIAMLGPAMAMALFVHYFYRHAIIINCIAILGLFAILSSSQIWHWENSVVLFEHTLRLNPKSVMAHNNLGNILASQGKIDEAINHYTIAIKMNANSVKTLNNLGVALYNKGKIILAKNYYHRALEIKPNYAEAYNNLGNALSREGKHQEAISRYLKAITINPNYAPIHNNLGITLAKQGKFKEAIIHYSKAVQLDPSYEEAHKNIGDVLVKIEKPDDAIKHYYKALSAKPDYVEAHNNLGVLLVRQGKIEEAISYFLKAIEVRPDYSEAKNNLANALKYRAGERPQPK